MPSLSKVFCFSQPVTKGGRNGLPKGNPLDAAWELLLCPHGSTCRGEPWEGTGSPCAVTRGPPWRTPSLPPLANEEAALRPVQVRPRAPPVYCSYSGSSFCLKTGESGQAVPAYPLSPGNLSVRPLGSTPLTKKRARPLGRPGGPWGFSFFPSGPHSASSARSR